MVISPRYEETKSDIFAPLPNGLKCVTITFKLPVVPHGLGQSPDKDKMTAFFDQYDDVCKCLNFLGSAVRVKKGHAYDYILHVNVITSLPDNDDDSDDWELIRIKDVVHGIFCLHNSLMDGNMQIFDNLTHLFDNENVNFVAKVTTIKGVPLFYALEKNQDRTKPTWNVPTIVIAMTHKETVQACRDYFCCGSVHVKNYPAEKRYKTLYGWTVRWNDARFVAITVRPFAITKVNELDKIINLPIQRSGPTRKFSEQQIHKIRTSYNGSYSKLGKKFGIAAMTAWRIVNRRLYADVEI